MIPWVLPVAYRTRSFLTQPHQDVETRLRSRIEASDALVSARLDQVVASLSAQDRASSLALRENRKLYGSLRDLIEDQAETIQRLQTEVALLSARLGEETSTS